VVEEEGTGRLLTSCNTPVSGGISILTDTQKVRNARRQMLELIFAQHPVDCTVCEAANNCRLRRYASQLGVSGNELPRKGDLPPIIDDNPFIHRDYSKCIGCGLCVRACTHVQGAAAVEFKGHGWSYRPASSFGHALDNTTCELCGLCVSLCPVGALLHKTDLHQGAEERRVKTVCPYCGCGCSLELRVANNRLIGSRAEVPGSWNGPSLCAKGRYGLSFVNHPDRLTIPLKREGDDFKETSWDDALKIISYRLKEIIEESGPSAIGILASAKATNEENYLIQKFARAAVGTNNVDHCARL
jgi:formate dehydrogenase alpha subunit